MHPRGPGLIRDTYTFKYRRYPSTELEEIHSGRSCNSGLLQQSSLGKVLVRGWIRSVRWQVYAATGHTRMRLDVSVASACGVHDVPRHGHSSRYACG